jgi:hypothetical protein
VPTLTLDGHPVVAARHQCRYAEPGAGAKHQFRGAVERSATGELHHVRVVQPRQRQRQCRKIVAYLQAVQAQAVPHRGDSEAPVAIGQAHVVTFDRAGDCETTLQSGRVSTGVSEKGGCQRNEVGEIGIVENMHFPQRAGLCQAHPRMRSSDIR